MAFPQIIDYNTSLINTNELTHSQSLPTDIESGNLLLCFFVCDGITVGITISVGSGWSELITYTLSTCTVGIYYKLSASGSSADNLSLTTNSAQQSASIIYAISGHDSSKSLHYSIINNNSTNADPPSLTPTHGRHDYLWFTCMATLGTTVASAQPEYFSDLIVNASSDSSEGVSICSSRRNYHTDNTAYNPSTFTSASAQWVAITMVIVPLEGPGFNLNNLFLRFT